jgi:hypothetical protein
LLLIKAQGLVFRIVGGGGGGRQFTSLKYIHIHVCIRVKIIPTQFLILLAQVSFSGRPLSVCLSVRLLKFHIFNFLHTIGKTTCVCLFIYLFIPQEQFFSYLAAVTITGVRAANSGLYSALGSFEQGGIFIVPHLLRHGASVYTASSERTAPTSHSGIRLIDYLLRFYVPLKNISLIWRRHHCR